MSTFSDETVMRYVDGELDEETSARLEAALDGDDDLNRRLERFAQTRLAAQQAMRPLLEEEVPTSLKASVEAMVAKAKGEQPTVQQPGAAPVGGPASARLLRPANDWWRIAAAACVAGIVGVGIGLMAGGSAPPDGLRIADIGRDALAAALNSVATGEETTLAGDAARFRAIASFHDSRQSLCREFELDMADGSTVVSVACRDGGWAVRFAVASAGNEGGYAPASSSETLEAYLAAIQAGAPLSQADERAALEKLGRGAE